MDFDAFFVEMNRKQIRFQKFWITNHKKDPKGFPLEEAGMKWVDWLEQFDMFED